MSILNLLDILVVNLVENEIKMIESKSFEFLTLCAVSTYVLKMVPFFKHHISIQRNILDKLCFTVFLK